MGVAGGGSRGARRGGISRRAITRRARARGARRPTGSRGTSGVGTLRSRLSTRGSGCVQLTTRCSGCHGEATGRGLSVCSSTASGTYVRLLPITSDMALTLTGLGSTSPSVVGNVRLVSGRLTGDFRGLGVRSCNGTNSTFSPGLRGTISGVRSRGLNTSAVTTICRANCGVNSGVVHRTVMRITGYS